MRDARPSWPERIRAEHIQWEREQRRHLRRQLLRLYAGCALAALLLLLLLGLVLG